MICFMSVVIYEVLLYHMASLLVEARQQLHSEWVLDERSPSWEIAGLRYITVDTGDHLTGMVRGAEP